VVTIAYAGIAVSGFLMFGESTMSQFTLNLPQQYIPSKIAIWMTVFCSCIQNEEDMLISLLD
jgi:solute carrier family 32 (vesicular inhibitory amino acid transporter)